MIEAISGSHPIMISTLMRVQNSQRKLSVPVKPYVTRYANFKHIIGVPSSEGTASIPVAKLRILDNLIEKISGQQGQAESFLKISNQDADQLIFNLKNEFSHKLTAAKTPSFNPKPGSGLLLNILA